MNKDIINLKCEEAVEVAQKLDNFVKAFMTLGLPADSLYRIKQVLIDATTEIKNEILDDILKLELHLETLKDGEQLIRIFGKAPNSYEPAVAKYLTERKAQIAPPDHVTLPAGELYNLIMFLKHDRIDFYIS